ncbi:MAG: glycyl-radical enzyme activating protein [Clostridiales bacterium]|jgi:pyruvate formate lyase activating enzyme|nr:glycyl-radical enzyme activating protein [Clostridiales bacterium]MDR2712395.1 glycyl-radical enzyme activating protein [Clostridiales bacterium]
MGTVLNIMKFAVHDGPGIRVTVFLKGCPLSCFWCHNPEGISPQIELLFYQERCLDCGRCRKSPALELIPDPAYIKTCPGGALAMAGREMSAKDVLDEVEKDSVFFAESGGGVTFSGGEPLLQADFLSELLREAQRRDIHRVVDTSGYAPQEELEKIANLVDLWLFDLKHIDNEAHQFYSGVGNRQILANLRWLCQNNYPVNIRIPLIPGVNDGQNIIATRDFLKTLAYQPPLNLLPFHKIGGDKYKRCGRIWRMDGVEPPGEGDVRRIAAVFKEAGFEVKIGG